MDKYYGLRWTLCIAMVALRIQMSSAGVLRSKEFTSRAEELTASSSSSATGSSLAPEDRFVQTTLPPILFRPNPFRHSDDTAEKVTKTIPPPPAQELPSGKEVFSELPGSVLPRDESPLDRESSLANSSSVGSDSSLVPTAELERVSSVSSDGPDVGVLAGNPVAVKSSPESSDEKRTIEDVRPTMEILARDDGIGSERTVQLPPQSDLGAGENITTGDSKDDALTGANDHLPETDQKNAEPAAYLASVQVFPKEPTLSDSFIPPAVQILAYTIDQLWMKQKHSWSSDEEKTPLFDSEPLMKGALKEESSEGMKIHTKQRKEAEKNIEDDDDDASNRPVFQTNVPIVNSESVPMRMSMDIIPVDLPGDFDDVPIQYPTEMGDYGDEMYNDSKLEEDTFPTGLFSNQLQSIQYPTQFFAHPWGKDENDEAGLIGGYPEDIERDVEERIDLLFRLQERTRIFKYSANFESLLKLHKELAAYARNHNVRKYKGYSINVNEVLQRTTSGNVADQLKIVIGKILEYSKLDDASLQKSLEDLFNNLSNPESEAATALKRVPALRYS